jgi:hypothetical protein
MQTQLSITFDTVYNSDHSCKEQFVHISKKEKGEKNGAELRAEENIVL